MFTALPTTLKLLIAPLLAIIGTSPDNLPSSTNISNNDHRFTLRHQHGVSNDSRIIFHDIPQYLWESSYVIQSKPVLSHKPESYEAFSAARRLSVFDQQSAVNLWTEEEVHGPDVSKRETLQELAKMASNAYYGGDTNKKWYPLPGWNTTFPFGWEPDADGFRGHIFVSDDNSTVVVSIKGTSAGWLAGDNGPSVKKDQLNDNLLFSCCCARVGRTWTPVCDCYSGGSKCDVGCLQTALTEESLFYSVGTNLYRNVTYLYPNANIWLVGHSLGGSLASLLGSTFGVPVVAFEAPGEKMASNRLHLPSPPSLHHITHVYHTADPIPQGACTGTTSLCAIFGYALETRCHLGNVLRYDTVSKMNWTVDLRTHSINMVTEQLLGDDWEVLTKGAEKGSVPPFGGEENCMQEECFSWEFGNFKNAPLQRELNDDR